MKTHYGQYGGQYVAETLMAPLKELEIAYESAKGDPKFRQELSELLKDYVQTAGWVTDTTGMRH